MQNLLAMLLPVCGAIDDYIVLRFVTFVLVGAVYVLEQFAMPFVRGAFVVPAFRGRLRSTIISFYERCFVVGLVEDG